MIHDILTSAGLNIAIRKTANGEEYAGFKMVSAEDEFPFTAIYRNNNLRIILHEILPIADYDQLPQLLNAANEKWLTVKYYQNIQSGFVEGSATLLDIDTGKKNEQILFYIRELQETSRQLRLLAQGQISQEDIAEDHLSDPAVLPLLKSVLIENDYCARWKFDGSVLATHLVTTDEKKLLLEFMIIDQQILFMRSCTEDMLSCDAISFFFDRMQFYNWTLDTGTIACIPNELRYYFFQAIPLRFLAVDTAFVKNRISQCIKAHEFAYRDIQKMYEIK